MKQALWVVVLTGMLLSACNVTLTTPSKSSPTPAFVTATLPPTRTSFAVATSTRAVTGTPGALMTAPANCKDSAVLLEDVTIPDGTNLAYGVHFTKTWKFRNTGTCPWMGYKIAFVSGDRLGAPDDAPVGDTAPKAEVDVSVDLSAPTIDGVYTGFFELHNSKGSPVSIGIEKTFWVKITVGSVSLPTLQAPVGTPPTVSATLSSQKPPVSCQYQASGSYPGEIIQLINSARADAGLDALSANSQLASAAQSHSIDMACYSLLSHTGSDGSSIQQRVAAAGYGGTHIMEIIYGGYGAYPQTAFDWWMNDAEHRAVILDPALTELGAGYAYVEDSAHGNYYTVDFGSR